ncbi:MAG: putative collagen-binding domain-containing protein [Planctomycetota bacterium]
MWDQTRYALEFFHDHLPFAEMAPDNALTTNPKAYCLAKPGEVYAIYLLEGGSANLNVAPGIYSVQWYNPRVGGELLRGSVKQITGPAAQSIGQPPKESDKDWAVLVRKTTP